MPKFKAALFEGPSGCPVTMAELTAGLQEHGAGFGYTELGDGCLSVAHYDKNTLHSELREGTATSASLLPTSRALLSSTPPNTPRMLHSGPWLYLSGADWAVAVLIRR